MRGDLASSKVAMEQRMFGSLDVKLSEQEKAIWAGGRGGVKVSQKVWVRSGCADRSCVKGRQRKGRWVGGELISGGGSGVECVEER